MKLFAIRRLKYCMRNLGKGLTLIIGIKTAKGVHENFERNKFHFSLEYICIAGYERER